MRFITPSFTSNGFGPPDLNAVTYHTSPAQMLQQEHPTGQEYAQYLKAVAEHFELPIQTGVDVTGLKSEAKKKGFSLSTSLKSKPNKKRFSVSTTVGQLSARFVIWASSEVKRW